MNSATHIVNERKKRIEPTASTCSFCNTGIVTDIEDCYFVPIYKIKDRMNVVVYRSVAFSSINIGIARCLACKKIHKSAQVRAFTLAAVLGVGVLAYAIYSFLEIPVLLTIILILLSGVLGFGGYVFMENRFAKKENVLPKHWGPERDQLVKEFISNGWSLTKPAA